VAPPARQASANFVRPSSLPPARQDGRYQCRTRHCSGGWDDRPYQPDQVGLSVFPGWAIPHRLPPSRGSGGLQGGWMTATIEAQPGPDEAPEAGQLVSVRDRRWVVTNVERSTQPLDVLSGEPGRHEHLVRVASVEDDGFGEELRVVWELELATSVVERAARRCPNRGGSTSRRGCTRSWTRSARGQSPAPTPARCRRRSAAASPSRTTNSTRSCGPCRCTGEPADRRRRRAGQDD
jgi:hypothetical protein